jgi:hypothetical protein
MFGWNRLPGFRSIQNKWAKWPLRILLPFIISNSVSAGLGLAMKSPLPGILAKYKERYVNFISSGDIRDIDPYIEL